MRKLLRLSAPLWIGAALAAAPGTLCAQPPLHEEESDLLPTEEAIGTSITPLPVIFYTPETKLAFGGAVTVLYRPEGSTISDRPSTFTPALVYTTRSQILLFLGGNHYWSLARNQLSPGISYRRFPDSFYGLGNDTDAEDDEDFTDEGWVVYADYQRELRSRWRAGFGANFANSSITETRDGDKLESGNVPGAEGGKVVGLGLLLGWDDRDNVSFPRRGQYHQFNLRFHDGAWGSDYDFTLSSLDLRGYLPIARDSALAIRALAEDASGSPPFQVLPGLGGDSLLRGYYAGRFRDHTLLAVQGELRLKVWKRIGAAVFAGAGQVAPEVGQLGMGRFHPTVGTGLRVLLVADERLHLRCDFGFGEDSSGVYFSLGEAF